MVNTPCSVLISMRRSLAPPSGPTGAVTVNVIVPESSLETTTRRMSSVQHASRPLSVKTAWFAPSASKATTAAHTRATRKGATRRVLRAYDGAVKDPLNRRQAELAQERYAVGVDVLAGNEAVLDRDHVHAAVLDAEACRLDLEPGSLHLPEMGTPSRPLLNDEIVAEVLAARLEVEIGEDREDPADRAPDRFSPDVEVAGRVILEHRVVGVHLHDRVDVVVVPRAVVAIDELLELGAVQGAHYRIGAQ